jgi:hypothetical protein
MFIEQATGTGNIKHFTAAIKSVSKYYACVLLVSARKYFDKIKRTSQNTEEGFIGQARGPML